MIALLLAACSRRPEPAAEAPQDKPADDSAERTSVLELAHGATVISRSGELMLELSPIRAIDGEPASFWMNPPHDLPQSMTIALPARSRIDKIGIRTISHGAFTANHVVFESSLDGRKFMPVTTVKSADSNDAQWFEVKPFDASMIRVTMSDPMIRDHDVELRSVLARGVEVERPHPGDITGCWSFNGQRAQFERRGTHVVGVLEAGKEPMHFDGGFDGRVYRLNWIRGNDYGMTIATVSPDGQHLNAVNYHEEVIPMFFDIAWYGQRQTCTAVGGLKPAATLDVPMALIHRTGRFSLYDDSDLPRLLRSASNAVLVAHEFNFATTEQNRAAAERTLAALRQKFNLSGVKFVAQGSDDPRQPPVTDVMRALYSTVDLEIRR